MEQNSTPDVPAKKDSHWITILAMALFVLGSLVTVAFLYYQNQSLKKMLASYQNVPSPTPTVTADPTANWETYTNQKYGFSFKYPVSFVVQEAQNSNNYEVLLRDKNQVPALDILVAQNNIQLDNTFQTQRPKIIEKLTWQAYYSPKILGGPDPTKNADELQLHLQQNEYWFVLRFYGQKELTVTQNQILSTFKFLGGEQATGAGCTYQGKTYKSGDAVPPLDKCNACSCENGQVACTLMACD